MALLIGVFSTMFLIGIGNAFRIYCIEYNQFVFLRRKLNYKARKTSAAFEKNSFFDYKILVFVFIILVALLLILYPHGSYFRFPSLETQFYIIDKLLRTSSVFIGIIISLIILSFQIFNKNFGRYAFIGFFRNWYIKSLFTFYIVNILLSIYALSYLKELDGINSYSNSIFIFCIGLTILLIIIILPISVQMILKSQSRFNIEKIISLIDEEWIYEYQYNEQNNIGNLEIIEKNPIGILKEVGMIALARKDNVTIELILNNLYSYLTELVLEHKKKNNSINRYLDSSISELLKFYMPLAIENDNDLIVSRIVQARNKLEKFKIENRLPLSDWDNKWDYKGHYICFDYDYYFSKAILSNNTELGERVLSGFYDHCRYIVKEYFPKVFKEYVFENYMDSSNEKHMTTNFFMHYFEKFVDKIILNNKIDLFEKVFNMFSIEGVIIDSENSVSVKEYMLQVIKPTKEKVFKKYLNTGIDEITMLHFPFYMYVSSELEKTNRKGIFNSLKAMTKLSFSKEKLNNLMLNYLKAIAFDFLKKWKNKGFYKKLFIELIEHFEYMKNVCSTPSNNYHKEVYINLYRFLGYIRNSFYEERIKDKEAEKKLTEVFDSFDKIEIFKKELLDSGYSMNDKII